MSSWKAAEMCGMNRVDFLLLAGRSGVSVADLDNAETAQIGIAHRSYRLRRLESYPHRAEETKRYALAAQLLKQAAEDMGGAYTSQREITGKDGAPLVTIYKPEVLLPDNGREEPEACGGSVRAKAFRTPVACEGRTGRGT